MTPAARLSAAIEVLDAILLGQAPEMVLTNWGRANRFAGQVTGPRSAIWSMMRCGAGLRLQPLAGGLRGEAWCWGACGRQVWR